jgi:hypothetical protein
MQNAANKVWVGPIPSNVCGRTDHLPVNVPSGAYVLTADIVSGLGEGNTIAGFYALEGFFGKQRYQKGSPTTEVVVAGGEFVLDPQTIARRVGGGDLEHGQEVLDDFIVKYREKTIKTLKNLPGPKKD